MSFRTNHRTGGVFRTQDYTQAELQSQSRRFVCPRCEAMMGADVPSSVTAQDALMSGHETAGTPLSSFVSRAELQEHVRRVHGGQRFPTKTHRTLGRSRTRTRTRSVAHSSKTRKSRTRTRSSGGIFGDKESVLGNEPGPIGGKDAISEGRHTVATGKHGLTHGGPIARGKDKLVL